MGSLWSCLGYVQATARILRQVRDVTTYERQITQQELRLRPARCREAFSCRQRSDVQYMHSIRPSPCALCAAAGRRVASKQAGRSTARERRAETVGARAWLSVVVVRAAVLAVADEEEDEEQRDSERTVIG